jgi:acyl carrier protein
MAIEDRIRDFIVDELGWRGERAELTDDYPLIDNDVIDSLGIFQIVTFLEESEGVEVADDDLVPENFVSIRAIARMATAKAGS